MLAVRLLIWLPHATPEPEFSITAGHLVIAIMRAFCESVVFWVLCMALEPFVRRHWPQTIVAWSRLLRLRFLDPTVGEHVLLGVALGSLWAVGFAVEAILPARLGLSERPVILHDQGLEPLLGGRFTLAALLDLLHFALYRGLAFTLLVVLVGRWVPRTRPTILVTALLVAPMVVPRGAHPATAMLILWGLGAVLGAWIIMRFGLVAVSVGLFTSSALLSFPAITTLRVWYADIAAVPIALCGALLVGGLVAARSRPYPPDGPRVFVQPVPLKEKYVHLHYHPRFRLPLYEIVFHDSVVSTHHWSACSLKFTNVRTTVALTEVLYQCPPLYHLNLDEWQKHRDTILKLHAFWAPIHRAVGLEPMTDFPWLTPDRLVQKSVFGGRVELIANFSDHDRKAGDLDVPRRSVIAQGLPGGPREPFRPDAP